MPVVNFKLKRLRIAGCSQQQLVGQPDCSVRSPARKSGRTTRRQGMRLDGHPFVWKLRTYGTIEIAAALNEEVPHIQKHKSTNPRR